MMRISSTFYSRSEPTLEAKPSDPKASRDPRSKAAADLQGTLCAVEDVQVVRTPGGRP